MFLEPKLPLDPPDPAGPLGLTAHEARVVQVMVAHANRVSHLMFGDFIVVLTMVS